jgi:hypothetical protein
MKNTFEYCIPTYNGEDNWHDIEAWDSESAAQKVAENYDNDGDHTLATGGEEYVLIRKDENSPIEIFIMSAEPSVDYYVSEVTDFKCTHCGKDIKEKIVAGSANHTDSHTYCDYKCRSSYQEKWYADYKKKYIDKD